MVQTLAARVTDTPEPTHTPTKTPLPTYTPTPALVDSPLGVTIASVAESYLTRRWDGLGTAKLFEVVKLEERSISKAMEANNVKVAFCVLLDYVAEIEQDKALFWYVGNLVNREYEQYLSVVMVKSVRETPSEDDADLYSYFSIVNYDGYTRDHKAVLENAQMPVLGPNATTNTSAFSQCMSQD